MSGEASEGTVREAFAAGVADYLVKPIRRNEALTLWQHVWRSMQALTGGFHFACLPHFSRWSYKAEKTPFCTGRRLEGAKKRAAEPSKGAASQVCVAPMLRWLCRHHGVH
jgi:DNA-binding response OmpR family regulator